MLLIIDFLDLIDKIMKYLVVDGCLHGTGIRDYYEGGYINPKELNLSYNLIKQLEIWLGKYEDEHYNGYSDNNNISSLDLEGKELAIKIKNELKNIKVAYYSDARLIKEIV